MEDRIGVQYHVLRLESRLNWDTLVQYRARETGCLRRQGANHSAMKCHPWLPGCWCPAGRPLAAARRCRVVCPVRQNGSAGRWPLAVVTARAVVGRSSGGLFGGGGAAQPTSRPSLTRRNLAAREAVTQGPPMIQTARGPRGNDNLEVECPLQAKPPRCSLSL